MLLAPTLDTATDVSLFSGCGNVWTVVFPMTLWSHSYCLSRRMRYQYELIVVKCQTTTSTFHKVV